MSSSQASFNVAIIGLGAMGIPMARRLIDSGLTVHGYDINPAATTTLEEAGGTASASPAEATASAAIVIIMVATAEEVASALFAPETGAVYGLIENVTIILHSTVPPTMPQDLRHRLDSQYRRSDVVVIDAPVVGGPKAVDDGTLIVMVSAAKTDHLERAKVKHVLAVTARDIHHISGPLGSASKVKVLNQVLCGIHLVAAAEIMSLTAVIGLDTRRIYEDVASPGAEPARKTTGWSWMFEDRVPRMLDDKLPMNSAVRTILKDMRIVHSEAERAGLQLRLCKVTHFVSEKAAGLGLEKDDSALLHAYLRREKHAGADQTKTLQTISEMGGLFPEEEAGPLAGLLANALAAIHAMAAYETLLFAEGTQMCRTLKQCRQWIDIVGSGSAASTMFIKGMPRIFESETHGTGSLELLVPHREGLLEGLVSRPLGNRWEMTG